MANTLKVKLEGTNVLTQAVLSGFDTTNALASVGSVYTTNPWTWTATQDCIVDIRYNSAYTSKHYIDDYVIADNGDGGGSGSALHGYFMPMKKGQVFKKTCTGQTNSVNLIAFGLKR